MSVFWNRYGIKFYVSYGSLLEFNNDVIRKLKLPQYFYFLLLFANFSKGKI